MDTSGEIPVFSDTQRELLHVLGYLQLEHGDAGKSATIFDVLCEISPFDPLMALSHACGLLRSGQAAAALASLDRLNFTGEDLTLAWLLRGQALSRLGRVAEAARAMRMFIRQRPADEARR